MKTFPMFLSMENRRVVIVGGGEQAAQKARLILKTEAHIVLLAENLDPELLGLVEQGRVQQIAGPVSVEHFEDAALVFVATGCAGADVAMHGVAKAAGAVVNVVDRPELCDAITPSIVDRDPVVIAIGTEGTAPVLGRSIKTQIETMLPPRLGGLAALAGRLRNAVAQNVPREDRRAFWAWVFKGDPARMHAAGQEAHAAQKIKAAIDKMGSGSGDAQNEGAISLVGAGPGARDLLTMRAVERLQEADVIFYDRLVDPEVLELARRDAERVFVGKQVGANAWPQEKICALVVSEAKQGKRVVRLKSGDPSIFGRATEELDAARDAGITVEIVPGVTAATAAAAAVNESLTERGVTDTVVFSTGQCQPGAPTPDWSHHLREGTTLSMYMATANAKLFKDQALDAGVNPFQDCLICCDVSKQNQRVLNCSLVDLDQTLESNHVKGGAVIMMKLAKRDSHVLAKTA